MLERPALRCASAALLGGLLPLAFAPLSWFWLAPLSLAGLFWLWRGVNPKTAFWIGFWFGCGTFGVGTSWVFVSIHEFGQAHIALSVGLTVALVLLMALYSGLVGYCGRRWFARGLVASQLLLWPALWLIAEWVRGWFLSGFGWLGLGYSQTDSWLMGYAPVAGEYGMSLAVLVTAGGLVLLALGDQRARMIAVTLLATVWGAAYWLTGQSWTSPRGELTSVSLIQGAVPQDLKWLPSQRQPTLQLYQELTVPELGRDLIIWPEAAIPVLYHQVQDYLARLEAAALQRGSFIVLGILRDDPERTFENSVIALNGERSAYVKRHLVPFGEYFPVPAFIRRWMRLMSLPYTDAVPGPDDQPPIAAAGQLLGITICYEDAFGSEQLEAARSASMLVNVSNDAWFGDSLAPHQHLQIARLRAAEAGRYLLRATNTGISAIIDPRGEVIDRSPQFKTDVLRGSVMGFEGATPYARVGNWLALGLAVLMLAGGYRPKSLPPVQSGSP